MTKEQLEKNLEINYQPKQQELYEAVLYSEYRMIGFGGSRGGGKSNSVRDIATVVAFQLCLPVLIFRRIREELLNNHVYPFLKQHSFLRKYFNKQELVIYHPITGLPAIKFGYAESDADIHKYQGTEYAVIFIDEATRVSKYMMDELKPCLRDITNTLTEKMVMTMNPGGVSHAYIKRIFIDKIYLPNEKPNNYYFIQAHVWDNWYWSKRKLDKDGLQPEDYYSWNDEERKQYCLKHSSYAQTLTDLPEDQKLAYLFGDWNVFAGMFFKGINLQKQIIKPFQIPKGWKLYGSLDPGYSSPCAFIICAVDYDFNIYIVASYYEREKSAPQHAQDVYSFITSLKITGGRLPERIVADPSAWQKRDRFAAVEDLRTFADHFNEAGINLEKGVNDRVTGWWNMKDFMTRKDKNGNHKFLIFDNMNQPLVDQLLGAMSDKKQVEDIEGRGNNPDVEDHEIDAARYLLMAVAEAVPEKKKDPIEQMLEDEMGDPEDSYSVMGI